MTTRRNQRIARRTRKRRKRSANKDLHQNDHLRLMPETRRLRTYTNLSLFAFPRSSTTRSYSMGTPDECKGPKWNN